LRLLSLTRLQKNPDSREFLRYAGYEEQAATASEQGLERDEKLLLQSKQQLSKVKWRASR